MNFGIKDGVLCIQRGEETLVSDITGCLKREDDGETIVAATGAWRLEGNTASCDNLTIEASVCGDGLLVRATFRNTGVAITAPCDFVAFSGRLHRTPNRILVNDPRKQCGMTVCEMQSMVYTRKTTSGTVYTSAENTAFDTVEGEAFIFGAATYHKYFSCVTVSREGLITAYGNTEMHTVGVGSTLTSEWFLLLPCEDCVSGLDAFAREVASLAGVERLERENPSGYCSWYYYSDHISKDSICRNMRVLAENRDSIPVKYIQIDEGWNTGWGPWETHPRLGDMKALADEIRAHGYIPGIWVAPFGCHLKMPLAEERPDWFVKNAEGKPWQGFWKTYCFDFTNPEVREYIGGIFRRICYDWGYRYIKLDIITPNLAAGVHYDSEATALENYRLGLKTIRENVTKDTFLLGCTAPFGGAIGLVDGMRVSRDINGEWSTLLPVFAEVFKRFYYHRNYYLIDADCLMARKPENEDEEAYFKCTRTDSEIRTYVTAMAASGGILMLSDKLPLLSEDQLSLISKLYPMTQECALPLDLMDSATPGVLDFGKHGKTRTVALINWTDLPRTMSVRNERALLWEFWEKEFSVHPGGEYSLEIPPHAARVLYFTEPLSPAVVGSDASVMMQSRWEKSGPSIRGQRLKEGEALFVASPSPLADTLHADASVFLEKDGYTVYRVVPTSEEYTLTVKP